MALIKCSECGRDVSDKADTCPKCGNPINETEQEGQVVTIQQTKKKWKVGKIITVVLLLMGLGQLQTNAPLAGMLFFFGVLILLVSRFGAWWTNG